MTTEHKRMEHCDHEKMCKLVILINNNPCTGANCRAVGHANYDTRSRPHTPAPPFALPKDMTNAECIIEGLDALTDYFNAAIDGGETKAALQRMWKTQMGVLLQLVKQGTVPTPELPISCKRCIHFNGKNPYTEAARAATLAENKRVLDLIQSKCNEEINWFIDKNDMENPDRMGSTKTAYRIRDFAETLRKQECDQCDSRHDTIKLIKSVPVDLTSKEIEDMNRGKNIVRKAQRGKRDQR